MSHAFVYISLHLHDGNYIYQCSAARPVYGLYVYTLLCAWWRPMFSVIGDVSLFQSRTGLIKDSLIRFQSQIYNRLTSASAWLMQLVHRKLIRRSRMNIIKIEHIAVQSWFVGEQCLWPRVQSFACVSHWRPACCQPNRGNQPSVDFRIVNI